MRRIAIFMLTLLAVVTPALSQRAEKGKDREAMRREVREFKIKYLMQEMELKEDQQKPFIEVYNQMTDEKMKVYRETRTLEKKLAASKKVSDEEYEAVTKAITSAKERDAAIEKKYDDKFSQFLTAKQIFKMKAAEKEFRKKMQGMQHNKKKNK